MKNKESSIKRLTFQGVINADQEKLPEKSRSKSKTRSKASSISKPALSATNRSTDHRSTRPDQPDQADSRAQSKGATSDSIFRSTKRNAEQEIMKKIIKLKNQTVQLEAAMREADATKQPPPETKEAEREAAKLQQMQDLLEEFDAEMRRQGKEIGDFYLKQLDDLDTEYERKQLEVPEFKPISVARTAPSMPTLEAKLKQMEGLFKQ